MSNLHKKLKSLRRERKIDLEAIEKRTKIDIKYLKAIENGKFEILPSTYIRLFLKAYCVEIGADPIDALYQLDELINNGKKSNNSDEEILPIIDINEDIDESSKIESSKSPYKKKSEWLKGFSMILLLLFSIYIIKKIVSSDENLSVAKNINETS
ncbi:MAG: helix-turn-helix transcriptional regulator, partial [Candidatus Neomarinimicrobiota bacterium]|nr:helix-turn-helix transcriptional regulator [Candidatus Neomarinimicrobiota bacterium]